jgi:hypothetical protein
MPTGPESPKNTLVQLRAEIQQLQNITAQQTMIASKLAEAYAVAEQMMGKLFELLERVTELEAKDIDHKSRQHHTNDAA